MKRLPKTAQRGFTLVELLVVIGIIASLIAILLPALSKARLAAVNVKCLANMSQVHAAVLMYTNDNHGWYPPTTYDQWQNAVGPGFGGGINGWGTWGDPVAAAQFVGPSWSCSQIWPPAIDPYLNQNRTLMVCAAIQFNSDPSLDLSYYAYYTGLDMLSGRIGAVRNEDLEPAWNPSGTAINALHIFLSCSNLFNAGTVANSEAGIQEYWGFLNTFGNFGQVHGSTNTDRENYFPTASRGGTKMNVMGLDGGVTVLDAKSFPATE